MIINSKFKGKQLRVEYFKCVIFYFYKFCRMTCVFIKVCVLLGNQSYYVCAANTMLSQLG